MKERGINLKTILTFLVFFLLIIFVNIKPVFAQSKSAALKPNPSHSPVANPSFQGPDTRSAIGIPSLNINLSGANSPTETANVIKILIMLTVLTLAPAILILMTSFTRIVVVLSFLRQAIGTQNLPPNQVVIGLSLFLTFMVMAPTFKTLNATSIEPYMDNKISQSVALANAEAPIREFMFKQVREKDIETMMSLANLSKPNTRNDVPTYVLIPAFILSELKTAFQMGFMLYLPFIVLDMVIASVLMAMGMMMLPPVVISLPFKILLFVLVDGWQLVVGSLVKSFA
jgi:flagellar biosynthetic protein FliP